MKTSTPGLLLLAVIAGSPPGAAAETIYYDYVDRGVLRGGRLDITPGDGVYEVVHGGTHRSGSSGNIAPPWPVETVVDNGPPANRLDVVVLGDGYTAEELEVYAEHVRTLLGGFFREEPFSTYASYFNVHRVDVVSAESGVDEPAAGLYRDTALDMTYDCAGVPQLLCVDVDKATWAASAAPAADQIIVLANTARYGGAGYPAADLVTAPGGYPSVNLALHEFGHALGDLADEYFSTNGSAYDGPEAAQINVTIQDAAALVASDTKWAAWLDHPQVDAFEGCRQMQYGLYRPTEWSRMRALSAPYGPVNTEWLILKIYAHVVPIDGLVDAPLRLDCAAALGGPLVVAALQPHHADMEISWSVNDRRLPEVQGAVLWPADLQLEPGVHDIRARVTDRTDRVRDELVRAQRMAAEAGWLVEVCPERDDSRSRVTLNRP